MQDAAYPFDGLEQDKRSKAFQNAARHSSLVRFLRRLIVFGSVAGVAGILGFSLFDPFHVVGAAVSISGAGLDGSKVTMQQPKMSGFQKDGRAYSMRAAQGVQDVRTTTIIQLIDLEANIGMSDKGTARITAPKGVYDSTAEIMDMNGPVKMKSDSGYDLTMRSARIEFKSNKMSTSEPVDLVINGGAIKADTMAVWDNGHRITFDGHVELTMLPAASEAATQKSLKGTSP